MAQVQNNSQAVPRCTLCPAGCALEVVQTAPDVWRTEFPPGEDGCVCPRGTALGDLLGHRQRILNPRRRVDGRWQPLDQAQALDRILSAVGDQGVTILLDGNCSCEQILAAAKWCKAWDKARLCLVIEPAEEALLAGTEASGATYLPTSQLAECGGFLIIGGALGANPACARGLLDRHKDEPSTPVVVIDPAAGVAVKFATHRVDCPAGGELATLLAVAAAAGVDVQATGKPSAAPSATAAGKALAGCKKLAVLIAAEHGRGAAWREIGLVAGTIAKALGGGVTVQTTGANALAAVRLAAALGTVSLAQALSQDSVRVTIGCDVLGMLGWAKPDVIQAAAAALPNPTTEYADIVLPLALPVEMGGEYLLDGAQRTHVAPLLAPPVGAPTPAGLVEALAHGAGVTRAEPLGEVNIAKRASGKQEPVAVPVADPPSPALLLARRPAQASSGALTSYGGWQAAACSEPLVDMPIADARGMGLKDRQVVCLEVDDRSVRARLRLAAELAPGVAALSEGFAQCRSLLPCQIEDSGKRIVSAPMAFTVRTEVATGK